MLQAGLRWYILSALKWARVFRSTKVIFFFFKQKTAYEMLRSLVGSAVPSTRLLHDLSYG